MNTTLVVLAAGMGSRYGGLKQLDPVGPNGEVILDYSVRDALAAGFTRVVFVIRRDFESEFRKNVASRYEKLCDVDFAFQRIDDLPGGFKAPLERSKPWGTGHAILAARTAVSTPFLVVNADDFYGAESYRIMHTFLQSVAAISDTRIAMVAYELANTLSENAAVSRGVCSLAPNGSLASVEECTEIRRDQKLGIVGLDSQGVKRRFTGREPVSMNFWGFTPAVFQELEELFVDFLASGKHSDPKAEFYIPNAVSALIKRKKLHVPVFLSTSRWFGVTVREDRETVIRELQKIEPVYGSIQK